MDATRPLIRTSALVAVLLVLVGGVVLGATTRHAAGARDSATEQLSHEAELRVAALENYFERARAVNLVIAENPAFSVYYELGGPEVLGGVADTAGVEVHEHEDGSAHRHGSPSLAAVAGPSVLADINSALAQIQTVFPGAIGETCFIDLRGPENARVVRGEVAAADELSPDETGAPFFTPTASSALGQVHQARPYVSPDTDEWVISNSTLIDGPDGPVAMVHFEVTIESFRVAAAQAGSFRTRVIDAETGQVIIDTELAQGIGGALGGGESFDIDALPSGLEPTMSDSSLGHTVMQRVIDASGSNVNRWVVAVSGAEAPGLGMAFGLREAALAALALMTAFAIAGRLRTSTGRLRDAAETDVLTGLANRQRFANGLDEALAKNDEVCVLAIDLNRFKEINDSMGHDVGDEILIAVAERLTEAVRGDDLVSRFGGDEFAVFVAGGEFVGMALAERIAESIAEPVLLESTRVQVTASIGISVSPVDADTAVRLLRTADMAMYHAKRHRLSVVRYEVSHDPNSPRRLQMGDRLRIAVEAEELDVHFQPQIDSSTGQVTALEALVRWEDEEMGHIGPDEFIPLAEDIGIIGPLTRIVLDRALLAVTSLRGMGLSVPMAVNISARSLFDPNLVSDITEALSRHGVPVHLLRLELTEGLLVGDSEQELGTLTALRRLGLAIALDDFGTGHSSLSYLSRLPVDELKIDRSFVMNVLDNPSNGFILRSAVDLGHNLGLRIVAEGVENEEVMDVIRAIGCDRAQGFHIARPMTLDALRTWMLDNHATVEDGPGLPVIDQV